MMNRHLMLCHIVEATEVKANLGQASLRLCTSNRHNQGTDQGCLRIIDCSYEWDDPHLEVRPVSRGPNRVWLRRR
jgi:hypothetical protein